ncbi:uncharacterized protein, partial [Argopecten irradians]|uniref:uncharacterized protein n=1 Tax=Argopecten irradians TaxID=31199 RepID=UPI003711E041
YGNRKANSMPAEFVRRGDDYGRRGESLPGHYNKDLSPNSSLDQYPGIRSDPRGDSLPGRYTGGQDNSPNTSNYSDAAYDRYTGQPNIPQRVPNPHDPYSRDQYNPASRSQDQGPRSHDHGYNEGPNQRFREPDEMMSRRDVAPQYAKHRTRDTPSERSSDNEAPRQADYEGFYSPTRESKQRELANRPLPAIKVPKETEQPAMNAHHQREDTDDGYSTLTKYQEQKRKRAQEQQEGLHPGPRSQHDLYDQGSGYPRHQEQELRVPEHQNETLHTYVNLPDRSSLRELQDRDDGVEYIEEVPQRPPLPTSVRKQIVEEIAQAKTPRTSEEILEAERNLETRMQQPSYFNYPTPIFPPKDHPVFDDPKDWQHGQQGQNSLPRPSNLPVGDGRGGNSGYYRDQVDGSPSRERTMPNQMYGQGRPKSSDGRRRDKPMGKQVEEANRSSPNTVDEHTEDGQTRDRSSVERLDLSEGSIQADIVDVLHEDMFTSQSEGLEKSSEDLVGLEDRGRSTKDDLARYRTPEGDVYTQVHRHGQTEHQQKTSKMDGGARKERSGVQTKQSRPSDRKDKKDNVIGSQLDSHREGATVSNYANMNPMDMPYEEVHRLEVSSEEDEKDLASRRKERRSAFRPLLPKPQGKNTLQRFDRLMGTPPCPPSPEGSDRVGKKIHRNPRPAYSSDSKQNLFDAEEEEETQVKKRISVASIASSKGSEFRGHNIKSGEGGRRHPGKLDPGPIHTVKEDPDMADEDVINSTSQSNESLRNKMKMEKDLAQVKNIMAGLNQQGAQLSEAMNTLRRSSAGAKFASAFTKVDQKNLPKPAPVSTYMETDLDSAKTTDLSQVQEILLSYRDQTPVHTSPTVTVKSPHQPIMAVKNVSNLESTPSRVPGVEDGVHGPWDIEDADENTKRFFGLLPKDKPKTLTVRDVKRQSEQRKEQLKVRKEPEEDSAEPWSYNGTDQVGVTSFCMNKNSNQIRLTPNIYTSLCRKHKNVIYR